MKIMTRKIPHDNTYKIVHKLSKGLNGILITSTLTSVITLTVNNLTLKAGSKISVSLSIFLALCAVLYFILDIVQSHVFHRAEIQRKNDFIDNSLKTKLADANSKGYFTNDEINQSIYKLGVNCFENSFFTKSISSKMLYKQIVYTIIIWTIILLIIFTVSNSIFLEILFLSLPFSIINDTRKLYRLNRNVELVFSNFKKIFNSTKNTKRESLIIDNVITYEKSLSYGSIPLNSDLFHKMNDKLSIEWNNIKKEHKIN